MVQHSTRETNIILIIHTINSNMVHNAILHQCYTVIYSWFPYGVVGVVVGVL